MAYVSGIPFQYEIEERVRKNGWETVPEQSYMDNVEEKPRPIDFVATVQARSHNPRGNQLALVVETKFLTHDVTVYVRENPKDKKAYFLDGFWSQDLDYTLNNFHFFNTSSVARNIDDGKEKKDTLFGAVSQASKALLYLRTKELLYKKGLFYPVVVYKGGTVRDQNGIELQNTLYYQTYEWKNPETGKIDSRALYVDIIHESNLVQCLDDFYKNEMKQLMELIYFQERIAESRKQNQRENPGL